MIQYRDYNYLGTTQSLCSECLELIPAKIISRDNRVYFRKFCSTHGPREDFVCSDASWFDRTDFILPGKMPASFGTLRQRGCPYDCGLCDEHEQHTCIGLLEITSHCNLECPICFAGSGPGGTHLTYDQCVAAIDRLVEVEIQPEVLQLSGGEPTIHPEFLSILNYACQQPIDVVMINTNGIRIARDPEFVDQLAKLRKRCEIYFQLDSLNDTQMHSLRGQSLLATKLKAIERLGERGIRTTLVCTVQADVNEDQMGPLAEFAMQRSWITGLSFQPTTYTGRYFLPADLANRVTFPDILQRIERQTDGQWKTSDFTPLPCAHPNAHTLAYAFRTFDAAGVRFLPLARFIHLEKHLELLSGRITFDRERAKTLIQSFLNSLNCGPAGCGSAEMLSTLLNTAITSNQDPLNNGATMEQKTTEELAGRFLNQAISQTLEPEDMLRVTTTSFMDAYNFDVRQLIKSCVHQILPSGHLIPFSAYNVLYRDGHLPLPPLKSPRLVSLAKS